MTDICVVYLSEDEHVVEKLVQLLRRTWIVWWARDIAHGDWEEAVRAKIREAKLVVPVLSAHAVGKRKTILKDEMRYADQQGAAILPFLIGNAEVPFGFGDRNYTSSHEWDGDQQDDGFIALTAKIAATIGHGSARSETVERPQSLVLGGKVLHLPSFVYSLSSHETQVSPRDGTILLGELSPGPVLVSAYDAWKDYKSDRVFLSRVEQLKRSENVLFLDSGNYEASRKHNHKTRTNPTGWAKSYFREIARSLSPDVAFSFDHMKLSGDATDDANRIIDSFLADRRAIGEDVPLCPIIHLIAQPNGGIGDFAAELTTRVAKQTDPVMLAIPERELGEGLMQRVKTVRDVRKALNGLGKYYPLHLLGTGNPLTMVALAVAGADSFDGLEWCRTVADYDNGYLFHFQQFEFFCNSRLSRIQDPNIRHLVAANDAPYALKALSYNVDFFKGWMRTMREMIHSGQSQNLLKATVPDIGREIFDEIAR